MLGSKSPLRWALLSGLLMYFLHGVPGLLLAALGNMKNGSNVTEALAYWVSLPWLIGVGVYVLVLGAVALGSRDFEVRQAFVAGLLATFGYLSAVGGAHVLPESPEAAGSAMLQSHLFGFMNGSGFVGIAIPPLLFVFQGCRNRHVASSSKDP